MFINALVAGYKQRKQKRKKKKRIITKHKMTVVEHELIARPDCYCFGKFNRKEQGQRRQ